MNDFIIEIKQMPNIQNLLITIVLVIIYAIIITLKNYLSAKNESFFKNIYFYVDIFILIPFLIFSIKKICNHNDSNLLLIFTIMNIVLLFYFFIRVRLPGKAWELVLVNKHKRNLDTLMVVLSLIFATSFGAITTFKIEPIFFNNIYTLLLTYFLFISTNIVIMTILVVLSTYVINTMGNRKPIMMSLVMIIGIGLLTYEILSFNKAYVDYKNPKANYATQK